MDDSLYREENTSTWYQLYLKKCGIPQETKQLFDQVEAVTRVQGQRKECGSRMKLTLKTLSIVYDVVLVNLDSVYRKIYCFVVK